MPNKLKYNVRFFRCYNYWAYKRDYNEFLRLMNVMNADKDQYIDMNIKQLEE